MFPPPALDGVDDGLQVAAGAGEGIAGARRHDRVYGAVHHAERLQPFEPLGEGGWVSANTSAQFVEPHGSGEEGPDDMEVPFLLEELNGRVDRTKDWLVGHGGKLM